jgi:hypothetical protein
VGFQKIAIEVGVSAQGGALQPLRLHGPGADNTRGDLLAAFFGWGQGRTGSTATCRSIRSRIAHLPSEKFGPRHDGLRG